MIRQGHMTGKNIPVLQTVGLTKVFKDFWRRDKVEAVKNLNLEIYRGEVFGLLGPNGSGKSTAIKMLLGLLYPTRGQIAVFGRAPTDVAIKARIGFLPEESYLYRFLNARETLDYYGRLFHLPARVRRERIEKLLDMVGLRHEARRRLGEYSKGMARRIGLAQALINDPDFLILDEPTAGMDPIGTRQIKDLIRQLGDRGKTILLSSHLLADVEDVCDRVVILYGGHQRAAGRVRELLSQEDRTQIITQKLGPQTIERIRDLIRRDEAKDVLDVSSPAQKLETIFLQIVEEAQAANIATSGARAAGATPDFLGTGDAGEDVVTELIEAAQTPPTPEPEEPAPVVPAKAAPADDVIEELVAEAAPTDPALTGSPDEEPDATPRKQVGADRGVIDSLLTDDKETNSSD
ncbi:MAG: ABC transporter ATP-binding protein [Phycisphaerales bacterium]|nr:MAG: ABC transporter ATP-binding protein [Phycisphaerales bacterium]